MRVRQTLLSCLIYNTCRIGAKNCSFYGQDVLVFQSLLNIFFPQKLRLKGRFYIKYSIKCHVIAHTVTRSQCNQLKIRTFLDEMDLFFINLQIIILLYPQNMFIPWLKKGILTGQKGHRKVVATCLSGGQIIVPVSCLSCRVSQKIK